MGLATGEITLDPKAPVVSVPDSRPPKKQEKKRKPRSDKGKKRNGNNTNITPDTKEPKEFGLSVEAKRLKKLHKPFDEYKKSDKWKMQVWPCWNDNTKYEIYFWFDGVRYGYKTLFDDASLAVTIGTRYLDSRYKNKGLYQ